MFNESEGKEMAALIKAHLSINGVGQAVKRDEIATQLTEIVRNFLAKKYSATKQDLPNIGVHKVKPLPEDFSK